MNFIIKLYALCVIIVIGLMSFELSLLTFIPIIGDIASGASDVVTEVIQWIAVAVMFFANVEKAKGKKKVNWRIFVFCGFIIIGVLDVFSNVVGVIPVVGDIASLMIEGVAEIIQIFLAVLLLL